MIYRKRKLIREALVTAEQGLWEARKAGSPLWEAEVYSAFGFHFRSLGACGKALESHERSLDLYRSEAASLREESVQRSYRASLLLDLGRIDEAVGEYRTAITTCRDIGMVHEQSWILAELGIALARLGYYPLAERLQLHALEIVERSRNRRSKVIRATDLAETALAQGQPERALLRIGEALRTAAQFVEASSQGTLPEAYVRAPYLPDALPHEMQAPGDHQRRGIIAARAFLELDRLEDALAVATAARTESLALSLHRPDAAIVHGVILHRLGRHEEARDAYDMALRDAKTLINIEPRLYSARIAQGIALAGLSLIARESLRTRLVQRSKDSFQLAWASVAASGVFHDARSLVVKLPARGGALWKTLMGRAPAAPTAAQGAQLWKQMGLSL